MGFVLSQQAAEPGGRASLAASCERYLLLTAPAGGEGPLDGARSCCDCLGGENFRALLLLLFSARA